jgi:hypothetical protein
LKSRSGLGLLQVLIGLGIVTGAFFLLTELTGNYRKQEKVQRAKMSGQEILSFVASQYQSLTFEKAACQCCRALSTVLPDGRSLTRKVPAGPCPALCAQDTALHGFRQPDGVSGNGDRVDQVFVTLESCDEVADGQALAVVLYGDWHDGKSARASGRVRFMKSRW